MADETISVDNITAANTAQSNLNDTIGQSLAEFKKFSKAITDSGDEAEQTFKTITKLAGKMFKVISPSIKEFEKFGTITKSADKAVKSFGKAYAMALYSGNKQVMVATTSLARTADALRTASRQTEIAADRVGDLSAQFKDAADNVLLARVEIKKLTDRQEALNKIITKSNPQTEEQKKLLQQQKQELKDNEKELARYGDLLLENSVNANKLKVQTFEAAEALKMEQVKLLEVNRSLLDKASAERQHNRDMQKMVGGVKSVKAAFGDVVDSKFFEYFKKFGTMAMLTASLALVVKALNQISDHAKATQRIAISLGDTSQTSGERIAKSFRDAQLEVSTLNELAFKLGYTMDELTDTMNKVRAGIRMDREGQLTSEAIRNMTTEIGYFARVSGIDLSDAFTMMETRVKRFGMSAAEATVSMQDMNDTLIRMVPDAKHNTVAMADMVHIIEEASAASQSYIVDTRIMTQALRGAVNQAEHLGVAQKQAKDVAVGVGKILSNAPDFIKIPAGFDLVHQLVGKDADVLLNKLDKGTRLQAIAIQKSLRAGKLDYYVGAKALMDLIGQTDAGLEAQSKQLEATILQGPIAAELIAEQYHIENRATAVMITQQMQEAVAMRDRINKTQGKNTITFATAMIKDTAIINDAIDKANLSTAKGREDLFKDLETKGLNPEQAKEYIATYQQGIKDSAKIREDLAKEQAKGDKADAKEVDRLQQQLFIATTDKNAVALDGLLRPVSSMVKEIEKKRGEEGIPKAVVIDQVTGKVKLDPKDLLRANIKSGEDLAKRLGIIWKNADPTTKASLNKMAKEGATTDDLEALHRDNLAVRQEAKKQAEAQLLKGPLETTVGRIRSALSGLYAPIGLLVIGMAGVAFTLRMMFRGQEKNFLLAKQLLNLQVPSKASSVYHQTLKALNAADSGPGSSSSGGGGGGGKGKKGKKGKPRKGESPEAYKKRMSEHKARRGPGKKRSGGPKKSRRVGKGRFGGLLTAGLAAAGTGMIFGGASAAFGGVGETAEDKEAKAAAAEGLTPKEKEEEKQQKLSAKMDTGLGVGGIAVEAAGSAISLAKKLAPKAGSLLKLGKMAKVIPIAGNVLSGLYAVKIAWDLYHKWKDDPNSITASDKIKMTASLVGMIPSIGNAVALADLGADMTGGYDLLDDVDKRNKGVISNALKYAVPVEYAFKEGTDLTIGAANMMANANAGALPGSPTPMPDVKLPPPQMSMARPGSYGATGGAKSLAGNVGMQSLTPDGALTIKVHGFQDVIAGINKTSKSLVA